MKIVCWKEGCEAVMLRVVCMSDEMSDMCGECCIGRMVIVIEEWMWLSNDWNDNGSNEW